MYIDVCLEGEKKILSQMAKYNPIHRVLHQKIMERKEYEKQHNFAPNPPVGKII